MAEYINKPGIDLAQIVSNGRLYPVMMTIPIGESDGEAISGSSLPGLNIPPHDSVVLTEDSNGKLLSAAYSLGGTVVSTLNFSYSGYTPVEPNVTTTITKS
jgi:hypothetical protein